MMKTVADLRCFLSCALLLGTCVSILRLDLGVFLRRETFVVQPPDSSVATRIRTGNGTDLGSFSGWRQALERAKSDGGFCFPWTFNSDEWWTHHPTWEVSYENDTHYCFSPIKNKAKAKAFAELYNVQFRSDCSNVVTKRMWSSGWGADFDNIIDGLFHAVDTGHPLQLHNEFGHWHYAATKEGDHAVCPTKHMDCYFLDISRCKPEPDKARQEVWLHNWTDITQHPSAYYYEFATRQQTWLRHEVYKFVKTIDLSSPCTVMHVRRADVVLHGWQSRRYHPIEEYIAGMNNSSKITQNETIFLLTDDQNAVEEALNYSQYNWVYIDRPRHRGAEGGWENQIPSKDPKHEVVVLLAIFRLVRRCPSIVFSFSNFARHLIREMNEEIGRENVKRINLDQLSGMLIFNETYSIEPRRS